MADPTAPHSSSDEFDLLDLLIVVAENLKLLVLVPLIVGLAALGIAFAIPKTYESQSILSPSKPGLDISGQVLASYIKSADILEAVANDIGLEPNASAEQRFKKLEQRISVSVGKNDQLVTLKTQGNSPESARDLNTTIWKHVLPLTIPRSRDMERLQAQLKAEQERLQAGVNLEAQMTKLVAQSESITEGNANLYGELLAANSARLRAIATLEAQIEGLTTENLAQQPTLPEASVKPRKAMIAIGATVATGFVLLLFVFARHALRTTAQNQEQAAKIQRLRQAAGLKD
ncbi:MAG TPA: Wzz/FepE/Etk N-terminal domain-containing protein [Comamonas sp.]|uniref:Wzz/FepE/Etk N-terminal domain-containing protein n=1 Tax=Comamonas halotolerans TaxID=3041496 RepID=UPI0024E0EED9|nr:Wzz/FepE/Etk N-terminal domain-containing protein [Comamonas sp. NoAH]